MRCNLINHLISVRVHTALSTRVDRAAVCVRDVVAPRRMPSGVFNNNPTAHSLGQAHVRHSAHCTTPCRTNTPVTTAISWRSHRFANTMRRRNAKAFSPSTCTRIPPGFIDARQHHDIYDFILYWTLFVLFTARCHTVALGADGGLDYDLCRCKRPHILSNLGNSVQIIRFIIKSRHIDSASAPR